MHAKPEGPLPICPHWQLNEANRDTPDPRTQVSGVTPPREGEVVAPSQTLTPKTNRHSLTSHNHTCVNHSPHPLSLSLEGKTITPIAAHTPPRTWDPRVAPNAERTKRWVGGKTRCTVSGSVPEERVAKRPLRRAASRCRRRRLLLSTSTTSTTSTTGTTSTTST